MDPLREEPPAPPSQPALNEMRRHLKEQHGLEFDPKGDLSYAGNTRADALLTHHAETPGAPEGF